MREESRRCQIRKKKYRSYKGDIGLAAPNILERNFKASKSNQKWATDVTEFKVLGQKQYFSPVIDLFNGEIISYDLKPSPALPLISTMLDKAIESIKPGQSPILHSDQGWQYRHHSYQHSLKTNNITQSMSRKGNCLDNAVAENFFGHFKEEFLRQREFTSLNQFKTELAKYIHWFNHERIQLRLKGLSPVDYRTQSLASVSPGSYLTLQ
jgi:putative transposase